MKIQEGKVPAGDIEIAWRSVGTGDPLVVVHGGPGLGHGYMSGLDVLADQSRVIFYDQRGSGGTELGDPDKVTFAGAIADLEALRKGLGIDKISLIGHSFGGLISILYASRKPDNVELLVSYDTSPPFVKEMDDRRGATRAQRRTADDDHEKEQVEQSAEFALKDPKTLECWVLNQLLPLFDDRESLAKVKLGFTDITAANLDAAWDRMFRDLADHDPLGSLAKITAPTLVVHCENGEVPEDFPRLLADKIANSEYAFLTNTNHFAHVENPQLFKKYVGSFLTKHAG